MDERKRREFGAAARRLGAVWLSNEAPGVLPWLTVLPGGPSFVLVRDGTQVLARTDPHGTCTGPGSNGCPDAIAASMTDSVNTET